MDNRTLSGSVLVHADFSNLPLINNIGDGTSVPDVDTLR
jgi:hypothetical protein